jgi:hypothetical protein
MNSGIKAVRLWTSIAFFPLLELTCGCSGGGLLDRSIVDSDLPVDAQAAPYPTAVRNSSPTGSQHSTAATVAAPTPAVETHLRRDRQQPVVTPLAVIPPELIRAPTVETQSARRPVNDVRQTLVDLTPATSWTPPSVTQVIDSETTAKSTSATSNIWSTSASKTAMTGVVPASAAEGIKEPAETAAKRPAVSDERPSVDQARTVLIDALEAEIKQRRAESTSNEDLPRLEQQLRLAYVSAGRLDDAVSGVESLDATQREAYKDLMFGLGIWLSPDESRRPPLRSAKVLHSLRDATTELATAGRLEVKNLVFCERVDHFGWYTEFPRKEFQPRQQVILYAEVENFSAEQKGGAGYETELQGSYVILDASGQEVASRQLQLDKEVCRNPRRDYFLAYRIYMPEGISPGRYRLELTVEDLKARGKYQGRKLGEGVIEFAIR